MRTWISLLLALAVVATGCGDGETPLQSGDATTSSSTAPPGTPRYTATATVLESPDHGPQLCLGGVMESYPPQCGGPDVIGWDWAAVDSEESASGTTWGRYTVVGTWDGEALTVTEPPRVPDPADVPDDPQRFATPCPPPEGGWQVVDPGTATDAAMEEAIDHARAQADVGGVWIDQSVNPAAQREPVDEAAMNDPAKLVLNVSFTGDLERHEAAIRELWGGALCVSPAPISAADLEQVREELREELGDTLWTSTDEVRGRIEVGVVVDAGLQQRLDERYGEGVVDVQAALEPAED